MADSSILFHFTNIPKRSTWGIIDENADLELTFKDPSYCNNSQYDYACGECVDSKSLDLSS